MRYTVALRAVSRQIANVHIQRAVMRNIPRMAARFSAASAPSGMKDIKFPKVGDSISEGTLVEWKKPVGSYVDVDEVMGVMETDKTAVEIRSDAAGIVEEVRFKVSDTVAVDTIVARVKPAPKPPVTEAPVQTAKAPAAAPAPPSSPTPSSSQPPPPAPAAPAKAVPAAPPSPPRTGKDSKPGITTITGTRTETRVAMSRMRQRIATRLKDSQNQAAMLTTFQECDMSALFELREKYKEGFEKAHGVKLGFMSPFLAAAAATLRDMPIVNAVIDDNEIVYRDYIDISVAVASPRGLVVPVIRDIGNLSFAHIEVALADLSKKARDDKLAIEDMAGGTFTISNGGVFGSMLGTPIINPPQSAILGMHATKMRPVAVNGKVEIRPVMYLALTYDHRLIDGREAVTFLASLRDKVEDPRRLLLGL